MPVPRVRAHRPVLEGPAWGAVAATAAFFALTCWWLSQDRAMPYSDAAVHLTTAFRFHDQLAAGHLLEPFTYHFIYAPLTPFVGGLGIFVGGRTVAAPIVTENLVYLPALALACFRIGRLAFGPLAGLLAVVFALGSPLIIEQFHVFMLDAPLAAVVAATVMAVLESDRFARTGVAALAGALAGLGLISKQSFPLYLFGLLAVVLVRGGWRNRRGLLAFALAALAIAGPWYAYHAGSLHEFLHAADGAVTVPPLARPPLLSVANATWYLWALANGLLFAPLLAFAAVGVAHAAVREARARDRRGGVVPELLGGLAGAWVAITVMPHHDLRYSEPLIVYLAVLGTGWIVRLAPSPRRLAVALLALAVGAATLGATFGVGPRSSALLPGNRAGPRGEGVMPLNRLTVYSDRDFMVSGPRNGGDILGLLEELRRNGIREVVWFEEWAPPSYVDFNNHGLIAFTEIAQVHVPYGAVDLGTLERSEAVLIPARSLGNAPPCVRLSRGRGLWIRLGNPEARGVRDYCPRFHPSSYGP